MTAGARLPGRNVGAMNTAKHQTGTVLSYWILKATDEFHLRVSNINAANLR
jgi:hypothetical protein